MWGIAFGPLDERVVACSLHSHLGAHVKEEVVI